MLLFLGPISVQIATGQWKKYLGNYLDPQLWQLIDNLSHCRFSILEAQFTGFGVDQEPLGRSIVRGIYLPRLHDAFASANLSAGNCDPDNPAVLRYRSFPPPERTPAPGNEEIVGHSNVLRSISLHEHFRNLFRVSVPENRTLCGTVHCARILQSHGPTGCPGVVQSTGGAEEITHQTLHIWPNRMDRFTAVEHDSKLVL